MQAVFIIGAVAIVRDVGVHQIKQRRLLHFGSGTISAQDDERDKPHRAALHRGIGFGDGVAFLAHDANAIAFRR